MRSLLLACGLAAACNVGRTVVIGPGQPTIAMNSRWIQGQPTQVLFDWPNIDSCGFDEWFCRSPGGLTTTVLSVTCHGCTVLEDPTGTTGGSLTAVAITDGEISVEIRLRFDATGDEVTLSSSAQGDHEVALNVLCKTIDVAELHHDSPPETGVEPRLIDGALLRPCGATRLANEVVVAVPRVRTFRDYLDFPFCFPGWVCHDGWNAPLRPLEQLSIRPAPVDWWQLTYISAGDLVYFAEFPADVSGSIEFSTQLLGGIDATASIEVPALAAQP